MMRRMRLLLALLVNLAKLLLWPFLALSRWRAAPHGAWLRVEIEGPVVELAPSLPFGARRSPFTLERLRRLVDVCHDDPRVGGLLIVLSQWQGGGATATALRRVLLDARERGVRIAVYLPQGGGTRTTYVASAANRVILAPRSHLAPLGYAIQAQYVKGTLDRLGVEPEVLARGRFKAAGETLISAEMSLEQRQQLEALLEDAHEALVAALAEGRGVSRVVAEQWVDEGPWTSQAAIQQGLADAIAYEDELPTKLDPTRGEELPVVPAFRYLRRRRLRWFPWRRPDRIGVIDLHGPIMPAGSGIPLVSASGDRFGKAIERALRDPRIRGAVLHVSSPGGSVLISDQMLHDVRRLAAKKPVVACFGDVAASGGYLAAMGAQAIFAEPTTITGSIGVVAVRIAAGPLLERLGISVHTVKRGRRADLHSPTRRLAIDEKEALNRELGEVYAYFVESVAQGRGRSVADVESLAEGRVYSGKEAHRLGLIDGTGGFPAALADLRRRIGGSSERMEPVVVDAAWRPPDFVTALLPSRVASSSPFGEVITLLLGGSSEVCWLWCPSQVIDLASRN